MRNKKIIIAGGTGFIGQGLARRWAKDNQVIILSRQSAAATFHDPPRAGLEPAVASLINL